MCCNLGCPLAMEKRQDACDGCLASERPFWTVLAAATIPAIHSAGGTEARPRKPCHAKFLRLRLSGRPKSASSTIRWCGLSTGVWSRSWASRTPRDEEPVRNRMAASSPALAIASERAARAEKGKERWGERELCAVDRSGSLFISL